MHILIGAAVGAVFALAVIGAVSLYRREVPSWKLVAIGALGGAVAGAVTSATLGAGGVVGATAGRQIVAFAAGGAGGGTVERLTDNVSEGRPLDSGLLEAAGVGAGFGVASLGMMRGGRAILGRLAPRMVPTATGDPNLGTRLLLAPAPGTGAGLMRMFRGPEAGSAPGQGGDGTEQPEAEPEPEPEDATPPVRTDPVPQRSVRGMAAALGF